MQLPPPFPGCPRVCLPVWRRRRRGALHSRQARHSSHEDGSKEVEESTMQRMTGIDPMFVYSDTPHTPMEIAYVCVFDPSNSADGYSFARVRDVVETRLPVVPPFRRRLMTIPLGLDSPRWVDDPEFDLADHLYRAALPPPGG